MRDFLALVYRFKPLRTAAQVMAPGVGASSIFDVDWRITIGLAAAAGVSSFLQILGEGGDMLADDKRVTRTKPTEPVLPQSRLADMHDVFPD